MAVTDRIFNEKVTKQVNEQFESVAKMFFFMESRAVALIRMLS